jgi:RsiW-degrading membrane proteinase PrsW (M82 family)
MVTAEVMTAREEAIEASGWGRSFTLVQPRNLAFWVYLVLVAAGVLVMYQYSLPGLQAYQQSMALSAIVFGAYAAPFVLLLRHIDRFDSVPGGLAATAFVWGGFAATGAMALGANNAMLSFWSKTLGNEFAFDWGPAITAPFDEEVAKALGIVLLLALAPRLIRTAFDGLIVGAYLGLGFQIVENVTYGFGSAQGGFGADQVNATALTLATRLGAGIASHWMYSGIFCAGLIWLIGRPDEPARRLRGALLMLAAMLLHGTWDAAAGFSRVAPVGFIANYLLVPLALVILFAWCYKRSVVTERSWMRALLQPEVDTGVLTAAELDAVAGSR